MSRRTAIHGLETRATASAKSLANVTTWGQPTITHQSHVFTGFGDLFRIRPAYRNERIECARG